MSEAVVQWLNEIKSLQQQLAQTQVALEASEASGHKWRQLYEAEAQQRRQDVQSAQQTIQAGQAQVARLKAPPASFADAAQANSEVVEQVAQITNPAELKARLVEMWSARDRLAQSLQAEQIAHAKTRKDLTTALADSMEVLKQRGPMAEDRSPLISPDPTALTPAPTASADAWDTALDWTKIP
jgi:hypothetical protein